MGAVGVVWIWIAIGCGVQSHTPSGGDGPDADADGDGDTDVDADADTDSDTSTGSETDPQICNDLDGDGYGVGPACDGPDCDDSNPDLWTEAQCDAVCDSDPHERGCACDAVEPEICYRGPEGTLGIGPCRAGLRSCEDGAWSACEGQVVPAVDVCNDLDDDCDGAIDEPPDCDDGLDHWNFCIRAFDSATFCGLDCSDGERCPDGSSCQDVGDGAGGVATRQCIPEHIVRPGDDCNDADRALCPPFCSACDSDEDCAFAGEVPDVCR